MEEDWVAKQEKRRNSRAMWYALWLIALVGLMQTAALHRVSQYPPSDVSVFITLEDITYSRPNGWILTVDRQTWQTWEKLPDGTIKIGGKITLPR